MTIERAVAESVPKPWGRLGLHPWGHDPIDGERIGEVWFHRAGPAEQSKLLLKLLFTDQPLSIQVHPDDAFARSVGLPNGKTEAWYVLSATPGAQVAIGLKEPLSRQNLRDAIDDGSIANLVQWHPARQDECYYIPAGTIHAIGAGLVLAEIQQQSDSTYRLFDYGRNRELHVDRAAAASQINPTRVQSLPSKLSDDRLLLLAGTFFTWEKISLPPLTSRNIQITGESWILVISGEATIRDIQATVGDSVYAVDDRLCVRAGSAGMTALIAYVGASPEIVSSTGDWGIRRKKVHGESTNMSNLPQEERA